MSNGNETAAEVLQKRWADPESALYTITFETVRSNIDDKGNRSVMPAETLKWHDLDYASFLLVTAAVGKIQIDLAAAWGSVAANDSEVYSKMLDTMVRVGGK